MRAHLRVVILPLLLVLILITGAGSTAAGPVAHHLAWWTVDGGGGVLESGVYVLNGTVGQHDAGTLPADGYVLQGGFWTGWLLVEGSDNLFLPVVIRS